VKKLIILLLTGLVGAALGWLWWQRQLPLVNPFWRASRPDLSAELTARILPRIAFDYSQAVSLATLSGELKYLVFDPDSGRVYAASGAGQVISPASFTKLLTSMVALDLAPEGTEVEATTESIDREPTVLGLKAGERLTVGELVLASIATSANDAASTLAEGEAGRDQQPTEFFIELMNQKAALLGLQQSNFANPEGYDHQQQFSTLEDIAQLVVTSLKLYPEIVAAGEADREDLEANEKHGRYYLPNWNGLLGVYPGVDGLKIAYTGEAGYSTIVTANREGKRVVAIVSGADSIQERDLAAGNLLDAAYLAEKIAPAEVGLPQLRLRYKQWSDLAAQIREELKALELESKGQ
jgi:D-alanyl-D-alanine carboxypeptidase